MSYEYLPGNANKPIVVLLHGFVSSKEYWKSVIPLLQNEGYGVVYIDLAGFGKARHVFAENYTYDSMMSYINSCLLEKGIDQPFILAGHSMGALVGAYFAKNQPERVERLIMLNPPLYLNSEQAINTLYATGRLYRFLLEGRGRSLLWGLLKLLPNQIRNHSGLAREQALQNIILSEKNFSIVTKPTVDSLLVAGKYDRPIYLQNLAMIKPSPLLQIKIIDTNHHAPRTDPELTTELILSKRQS